MIEENVIPQPDAIDQEQSVEQSTLPAQQTAPVETELDRNFRELRKEKQRLAYEHEGMKRRLAQYEATQKPKQESEDISIGDDDIVEGRHYKQALKTQRQLKADLEQLKQETSNALVNNRIRARFPDYDAVVNSDSVRTLTEDDPELANTLLTSTDEYNRSVLAYKEIKKRGIVPDTSFDGDKKRAQENAVKPKPLVSVSPQQGDSPLSHANAFANGLTPELQKQLWKEMNDAMQRS